MARKPNSGRKKGLTSEIFFDIKRNDKGKPVYDTIKVVQPKNNKDIFHVNLKDTGGFFGTFDKKSNTLYLRESYFNNSYNGFNFGGYSKKYVERLGQGFVEALNKELGIAKIQVKFSPMGTIPDERQ